MALPRIAGARFGTLIAAASLVAILLMRSGMLMVAAKQEPGQHDHRCDSCEHDHTSKLSGSGASLNGPLCLLIGILPGLMKGP
jgi:hypothetical protein